MIPLRVLARLARALWFIAFFMWQLVIANAMVAWEVITPGYHMRPGIVRVPIRAGTSVEIVLLANLISLTPGTLTVEVAEDGDSLFVHALDIESPDALRRRIGRLEDRLLAVLQ